MCKIKLSSRSLDVAKRLRDHEAFDTYGSLRAERCNGYSEAGWLSGDDLAAFQRDCDRIMYVVKSYFTPIAWVLGDGSVYKVAQKFSVTTSRHQGKLYLL